MKGLRPDKRSLAGGGYRTMGSSCAWICDDMCILYTIYCTVYFFGIGTHHDV